MAQRTIHMLFATLLAEKVELKDKNRFLIGNILPDSYIEPSNRKKAHFMKYEEADNSIFFDFHDFLEQFKDKIKEDDLYLGFYAHLVEDAFYRYFLYYEKDLMSKIPAYQLDILHSDYALLNGYIAEKYNMPIELESPKDFEKEELNEIVLFDAGKIIEDYKRDITEPVSGKTVFLTEEMLDEFIFEYIDLLEREIKSILETGKSILNIRDYKWEKKSHG